MTRNIIRYRLTLQAPLLLSVAGGDENSARTLDYISGSSIAGALANNWLRSRPTQPADLVLDPEFNRLFLSGKVRFLNVYPEGNLDRRLLPSPASLVIEKNTVAPVFDLAHSDYEDILEEDGAPRNLRPWLAGWNYFEPQNVLHRQPISSIGLHNQRDREMGRSTSPSGAIFSYSSLHPGERFTGYVLLDDDNDQAIVSRLLAAPLRLGRSKSAQYGGAPLVEVMTPPTDTATFKEYHGLTGSGDNTIIVTLLSDYLGVNDNGRPGPFAFKSELETRLDTSLSLQRSFSSTRPVSGYISTWRMPRPTVEALTAGSVFVFQTVTSIDQSKLQDILWQGIGDRRPEGFGRLAFNWHGTDDEDYLKLTPVEQDVFHPAPADDLAGTRTSNAILALCRSRLLQEGLRQRLTEKSRSIIDTTGKIPSKALLGRLRNLLRQAAGTDDITAFLNDIDGKPAGTKLAGCRTGRNENLREWLGKVCCGSYEELDTKLGIKDVIDRCYLDDKEQSVVAAESLRWIIGNQFAELVLRGLAGKKESQVGEQTHE